jgi:hypothetical protein
VAKPRILAQLQFDVAIGLRWKDQTTLIREGR